MARALATSENEWQGISLERRRQFCCEPSQRTGLQVSALERMYRYFWRHKGDIYHVLFDICRCVVCWSRSNVGS